VSAQEENKVIEVDVRGYSCPIPVVRTKKAIEENPGQPLTVLVETAASKENVSRLAQGKGYSVKVEDLKDGFKLVLDPPKKYNLNLGHSILFRI
jgi:tRNA 2-thiouridine synthesizing protein A